MCVVFKSIKQHTVQGRDDCLGHFVVCCCCQGPLVSPTASGLTLVVCRQMVDKCNTLDQCCLELVFAFASSIFFCEKRHILKVGSILA